MWGRRVLYLASLLGCLGFFGFYREGFSWILLLAVVFLPWLSLLLGLPAMVTAKAALRGPEQVQLGTPVRTAMQVQSVFPVPRVSCRLHLHNLLTGERYVGLPGEQVPTGKCGCMVLSCEKVYIYDYLGLFRRKLKDAEACALYIFPKPVQAKLPVAQSDGLVHAWRPKPGGGFSENRELRLYRPGDNLRHIHWKLTAKVGKPIYAEPIEPVQRGYLLTVCLHGDLEDKLGKLLYFSFSLLEQNVSHKVHCQTGGNPVEFSVTDKASFYQGLRQILRQTPSKIEKTIPAGNALWHHHIGGEQNEA